MFLSRNKKNNVYPCKPQIYYIKVGFKGVKLYRYVFVMLSEDSDQFTHQHRLIFGYSRVPCEDCADGISSCNISDLHCDITEGNLNTFKESLCYHAPHLLQINP